MLPGSSARGAGCHDPQPLEGPGVRRGLHLPRSPRRSSHQASRVVCEVQPPGLRGVVDAGRCDDPMDRRLRQTRSPSQPRPHRRCVRLYPPFRPCRERLPAGSGGGEGQGRHERTGGLLAVTLAVVAAPLASRARSPSPPVSCLLVRRRRGGCLGSARRCRGACIGWWSLKATAAMRRLRECGLELMPTKMPSCLARSWLHFMASGLGMRRIWSIL